MSMCSSLKVPDTLPGTQLDGSVLPACVKHCSYKQSVLPVLRWSSLSVLRWTSNKEHLRTDSQNQRKAGSTLLCEQWFTHITTKEGVSTEGQQACAPPFTSCLILSQLR